MEAEFEISAKVDRLREEGKVKAFCTLTIAGLFSVHGIRVVEGEKGFFVAMPSEKYVDREGHDRYSDIFHAVTAEARQAMSETVLDAYYNARNQEASEKAEPRQAAQEAPTMPN